MLPDRVSNPGPLTYELGALPIALRGPAKRKDTFFKFPLSTIMCYSKITNLYATLYIHLDFALSARIPYWTI